MRRIFWSCVAGLGSLAIIYVLGALAMSVHVIASSGSQDIIWDPLVLAHRWFFWMLTIVGFLLGFSLQFLRTAPRRG